MPSSLISVEQSSAAVLVKLVATSATRPKEPVSRLENLLVTRILLWSSCSTTLLQDAEPHEVLRFCSMCVAHDATRIVFVSLVVRSLLTKSLDL